MVNSCSGLSLYDPGTEELTPWGQSLQDQYEGGSLFGGIEPADESICRREGCNPDDMETSVRKKLAQAEEERKAKDLPAVCPHEPHDEFHVCLFHLTKTQREEFDITAQQIQQQFIHTVSNETGRDSTHQKQFVNTTIPVLDLEYDVVESFDNRPIDFRYAEIGRLKLDDCVFHEPVLMNHARIDSCSCVSTSFDGGVSLNKAEISDDNVDFSDSTFGRQSEFSNARFKTGKVSFKRAHFEERAEFDDVVFEIDTATAQERKANQGKKTDIDFRRCIFDEGATFSDSEVTCLKDQPAPGVEIQIQFRRCQSNGRTIAFDNARFGAADLNSDGETDDLFTSSGYDNPISIDSVSFRRADFSDCDIAFTKAQCDGDLILSDAVLDGAQVELNEIQVDGALNASGATFGGGDVFFNSAHIGGSTSFDSAHFNRNDKITFEGGTFEGHLSLDDAEFTAKQFKASELTVEGRTTLNDASFDLKFVTFKQSYFTGPFSAIRATIDCDRTVFDHTQFTGAFSFNNVTITGSVSFDQAHFLGPTITFEQMDAQAATISFEHTKTSTKETEGDEPSTIINLHGAHLSDGRFIQPAGSKTYYDFTEATVGDLDLDFAGDGAEKRLFAFFRFRETIFDGFDFSDSTYRRELKGNSWRLHTIQNRENNTLSERSRPLHQRVKRLALKYRRLMTSGSDPSFSPDVLESTYRKAKIGADGAGDSEASSKFFQKELGYRRRGHGYHAWLQTETEDSEIPTFTERVLRAWLWFTNTLLWLISGYGERPKRVILSSLFTIGLFAVSYDIAWYSLGKTPPETLGGYAGSLILSAETFTAIILGGGSVANNIIRVLSYIEGFVGSLFIALFVLTITRAIRR